jgi:neural Wiskott-Aldrich syndrome protein
LVETIPRRMRLGKASSAQVRISRDKIDGLILLLLSGRGMAHRPDAFITRALSVRLRAPDGGFAIEPASPETQWVEAAAGLQQDEFVSWRWTVTPQRRGRGRLLLLVTARTVGRDGVAAETAPPDRVIEVTVTGGRLRSMLRWSGLLIALFLGVALGRFGGEFWRLGEAIVKRLAGG